MDVWLAHAYRNMNLCHKGIWRRIIFVVAVEEINRPNYIQADWKIRDIFQKGTSGWYLRPYSTDQKFWKRSKKKYIYIARRTAKDARFLWHGTSVSDFSSQQYSVHLYGSLNNNKDTWQKSSL